MTIFKRNNGKFTSFIVRGKKYEFRKRFVKNMDGGNILDMRYGGQYIGATSIDMPYNLRKEAREFILREEQCDCAGCKRRRKAGLKP